MESLELLGEASKFQSHKARMNYRYLTRMLAHSLDKRPYESTVYEDEPTDLGYENKKAKKVSISREFNL